MFPTAHAARWTTRPSPTWETIPGASGSSYTPTAADQGHCIRVTAIYNDRAGTGRSEQFLTTESVEIGPFFDRDEATARVQENSSEGSNVGQFRARHSNSGETLTYSQGGADAIFFTVDAPTGQLRTSDTPLDYESQPGPEAEIGITARDNNGEEATIFVTVTVTNECRTSGESPCAPGRPGVSSASDTSLRVTWGTPGTPSGEPATGYNLQYRESGSSNWTPESVAGTDRSYTIENLIKDTPYEVQVRASNDNRQLRRLVAVGHGHAGLCSAATTTTSADASTSHTYAYSDHHDWR